MTADALPDDPGTLKAMLLAERARAEWLEQIIKELQRHPRRCPKTNCCSGLKTPNRWRRAESSKRRAAASAKRAHAAAKRLGVASATSAAHRDGSRHGGSHLSGPPQRTAPDRRGSQRTARHLPGTTAGLGRAPAQICLSGLRGSRGAGPRAGTLDGGWAADAEATVAHVLVAKYADYLPLDRQAQIYARQGITLDRSTPTNWVGRAAFMLRSVMSACSRH
jgi:transposase